jgi:hypothetical protein
MRQWLLILLLVVAGTGQVASIMAADATQNIHRINLFAEGVWALQSALIAAVGIHGVNAGKTRT